MPQPITRRANAKLKAGAGVKFVGEGDANTRIEAATKLGTLREPSRRLNAPWKVGLAAVSQLRRRNFVLAGGHSTLLIRSSPRLSWRRQRL